MGMWLRPFLLAVWIFPLRAQDWVFSNGTCAFVCGERGQKCLIWTADLDRLLLNYHVQQEFGSGCQSYALVDELKGNTPGLFLNQMSCFYRDSNTGYSDCSFQNKAGYTAFCQCVTMPPPPPPSPTPPFSPPAPPPRPPLPEIVDPEGIPYYVLGFDGAHYADRGDGDELKRARSFYGARTLCARLGGALASPKTEREQLIVRALLEQIPADWCDNQLRDKECKPWMDRTMAWFGLKDVGSGSRNFQWEWPINPYPPPSQPRIDY